MRVEARAAVVVDVGERRGSGSGKTEKAWRIADPSPRGPSQTD